jgi:hypothetical protein
MRACLFVVLTSALSACAEKEPDERPNLTQREKDSIVAGSRIPGARAVKKAMSSADSASARQAQLDSAEREP